MTAIKKGDDGTYRWVYEFDMLKNPVIILTVWKIFFLILLGLWLVFGLFRIKDLGFLGAFSAQALELLLPALLLFVLSVVGYVILASIYGWKYCVLFEMNEKGVRHVQLKKQFKKAQALGFLTALVGVATKNVQVAGVGLKSATQNELYSAFSNVKRMRVIKIFHTVKLNSPFNHNQIYADEEDFEFVKSFVAEQIGKSKYE